MAESEASLDEQLALKKRARRRLVGAAALALLAAIVLPMVMDHEPRPANPDIQIRIPSQETGAARVLSAKPAATPLPPAAEVPVAPELKPAAQPEEQKAAPDAKAAPEPKAGAKADAVAPKAAEEAHAAGATSGDAAEQWVVQLGAYKEIGNVKLLASKLKGLGLPAYTEKFDSPQGPRTRVRAGPFPSKEAAEKARTKVRIIGVDGPVAQK